MDNKKVDSLTAKTLHGIKWTYMSGIINALAQIAFSAVMARLLEPSAFGIIAMAMVLIGFGNRFTIMGIGSTIIQKKEITEEDIRASFTSSFFLGILFFILFWFISPLTIYIFKNKEVIPVLKITSISFILSSLSITSSSILTRNMMFRYIAINNVISYIVGYGLTGIIMASRGFGVWSLVFANLTQMGINALLCYFHTKHPIKFIYKRKYYRYLFFFGGKMTIVRFLEFISANIDTLFIGHFLGSTSLGLYNRAYILVCVPTYYFTNSLTSVLFPSLSKLQEDNKALKKWFLKVTMLLSAFIIPLCFGISAASREIILTILGDKWIKAIPIMQILSIAMPPFLLAILPIIICDATARLNVKIVIQLFYILFFLLFFYFMINYGLTGCAFIILIGEFIRYIIYISYLKNIFNITIKELFEIYVFPLLSGLVTGLLIYCLSNYIRIMQIHTLILLFIQILLGIIILFVSLIINKKVIYEVKNIISNSGIMFTNNILFKKLNLILNLTDYN